MSSQSGPRVRVSSTDDLSFPISTNAEINDTIQTIVGGRKCWKTMKGKGEVVWPPNLEAALVEGLEKYQPVESRTSRSYGRFPMRNKFISDYIFKVTGKRRTPKQVGSRLQQLRDTTEGKRILQVLSSRHIEMMRPTPKTDPSVSERAFSHSSPSSSSSISSSSVPPCSYYSIDVLVDQGASPSPGLGPLVPPISSSSASNASQGPSGPRSLRSIDPTVTFVSRSPLNAYSSFRVLRNGIEVHAERTELKMRSSSIMPTPQWPSEMECKFWYTTSFIPKYWKQLCTCPDPTSYHVVQDIVRSKDAAQSSPSDTAILLSVVYQFNNPFVTPPLSPDSVAFGETETTAYSVESSPELGSEFDDLLTIDSMDGPSNRSGYGGLQQCGSNLSGLSISTAAFARHESTYASVPPSPLDLNGEWRYPQPIVDNMHIGANFASRSAPTRYGGIPSHNYAFDAHYSN